ncbi:MAG TPA: hypothetical protein VHE30_13890 [Polyangiaceae bacterium]|nr:hypothetical protein [Polyangiaceae bacterium]
MNARVVAIGLALLGVACQGSSGGSPPATSANGPANPEPTAVVNPEPTAVVNPEPSGPTGPATSSTPAPSGTLTVAAISAMGPGARGSVRGVFLGWNGSCRDEPPTRSAWMLGDGPGKDAPCVYVDGPMPPGVSPGAPPPEPVWVRIDAEVRSAGPARFLVGTNVTREAP